MSDPEKYLNADGDPDLPDSDNSDNSYAKITQKLAKGMDTGMAKRRGRASGLAFRLRKSAVLANIMSNWADVAFRRINRPSLRLAGSVRR
jgi:hypothetical protein